MLHVMLLNECLLYYLTRKKQLLAFSSSVDLLIQQKIAVGFTILILFFKLPF